MRGLGPIVLASAVAIVALAACRKKSPDAIETPSARPTPQVVTEPRCGVGPESFTIGESKGGSTEDGGDDLQLPFAVEVGGAVPTTEGFAVAALKSQAKGSVAVVALLDEKEGGGRIIELDGTLGAVTQ